MQGSFLRILFTAITGLSVSIACGQDYPNKPIRIVTPGVGSSSDFVSRLIAQEISGPLDQPVTVDNRPSVIITGDIVAKAPPDGYSLMLAGGTFTVGSLLQKMPFDPVRDFSPITRAVWAPNVLVVHPSLPVKSVKQLIALAKSRPGELNYASSGVGGSSHLSAELFKSVAGVNIVHVPYKTGSSQTVALLGGEVQVLFSSAAAVVPHIKSGKLRSLAVTSAQPSALFPDLPTVAGSGLPGYDVNTMFGIYAPAKTPKPIINRLNQEIVRALNQAGVKERLLSIGLEAAPSSPEELAVTMHSEIAKMGKVIKDAGIKAE